MQLHCLLKRFQKIVLCYRKKAEQTSLLTLTETCLFCHINLSFNDFYFLCPQFISFSSLSFLRHKFLYFNFHFSFSFFYLHPPFFSPFFRFSCFSLSCQISPTVTTIYI